MLSLVAKAEFGITRHGSALWVTVMCHANSQWRYSAFTYRAAGGTISKRNSLDPENFVRTVADGAQRSPRWWRRTPSMMLDLSTAVPARRWRRRKTRFSAGAGAASLGISGRDRSRSWAKMGYRDIAV
jgi:hypothetical protein